MSNLEYKQVEYKRNSQKELVSWRELSKRENLKPIEKGIILNLYNGNVKEETKKLFKDIQKNIDFVLKNCNEKYLKVVKKFGLNKRDFSEMVLGIMLAEQTDRLTVEKIEKWIKKYRNYGPENFKFDRKDIYFALLLSRIELNEFEKSKAGARWLMQMREKAIDDARKVLPSIPENTYELLGVRSVLTKARNTEWSIKASTAYLIKILEYANNVLPVIPKNIGYPKNVGYKIDIFGYANGSEKLGEFIKEELEKKVKSLYLMDNLMLPDRIKDKYKGFTIYYTTTLMAKDYLTK